MTHDELLAKINEIEQDAKNDVWSIHNQSCYGNCSCEEQEIKATSVHNALRAVVELHQQLDDNSCRHCVTWYPCPTIQAIQKELS